MLISDYCTKIRENTGFSVNAFAKSRGVSHTYVMDVESGKKDRPSIAVLNKLISVYDLTSEDLAKLDVSSYILDDAITVYSVLHPLQAIKKGSYKSQIFKFIHKKLEPAGYSIDKTPIFESKNKDYKKISIDSDGYTIPIFDFNGMNPNGVKFYAYVLSPAYRTITEDKYYELVLSQMINVADSIRYSKLKHSESQVELMFISFSAQVNDMAKKAKDIFEDTGFVINTVPYFFNIKIPESDN